VSVGAGLEKRCMDRVLWGRVVRAPGNCKSVSHLPALLFLPHLCPLVTSSLISLPTRSPVLPNGPGFSLLLPRHNARQVHHLLLE
jgi:hypothetical protein